MGYRSKVIIGVKKGELSNEFEKILKKNDFQIDQPHTDHLVVGEVDDWGFVSKTYTFNYIKWYYTDDWCKEIMDWLEKQEDYKIDKQDGIFDVFCLGMGEDGQLHSEVGDYHEYIDVFMDIELQNN